MQNSDFQINHGTLSKIICISIDFVSEMHYF